MKSQIAALGFFVLLLGASSCQKSQNVAGITFGNYRVVNSEVLSSNMSVESLLLVMVGKETTLSSLKLDKRGVTLYNADGAVLEQLPVAPTEEEVIRLTLSNKKTATIRKVAKNELQLTAGEFRYTLLAEDKEPS